MKKRNFLLLPLVLVLVSLHTAWSQSFPDRVIGQWTGIMHMYKDGNVRDSVKIRLTVVRGATANTWSWKTEYLSEKMPMTKDYTLKQGESSSTYLLDEGGGIVLQDYQFGNKLYSVFETHDVLLTSTYELRGEELVFEVTSGKKIPGGTEVINFTVQFLQRAVLRRSP